MIHRLRTPVWLAQQPRLRRRCIVFQSDDWGQPCVRDAATLKSLWPSSVDASARGWMMDARESVADIERLSGVLDEFHDRSGRSPCFTLNYIVHQPDYDAIEQSAFTHYASVAHEPDAALAMVVDLARLRRVFEPALHGAEHVAPEQWLALMRAGDADALAFFRARVMPPPALVARHPGLGAAYLSARSDTPATSLSPAERVTCAARTFERLFGAPARGFVAPNHAWEASLEDRLASLGIRYIQAAQHWYPSWQSFAQQAWVSRHAGEIGQSGLCYQTRNIDFEPAVRPELTERAVRRALLLAERRIPIVVNTHRINYVGGIDADSAERGRTALRSMIERLLANFPDLEFATSSDLDLELRRTPRAAASRPSTRWWEFFGDAVRVTVRRDAFHDME